MATWVTATGYVIEKKVQAPAGSPDNYWTNIMVDLDTGDRITVLLEPKDVERVTIGDYVRLDYQPGQKAGPGFFRRKGLCRNLEVLKQSRPFHRE